MKRSVAAGGLITGLLCACSSTQTGGTANTPARQARVEEPIIHLHDEPADETPNETSVLDAGTRSVIVYGASGDGGTRRHVIVSADAGAEAREIVWLLAHIGDTPDRLRGDDSPEVRLLAERGVVGVRAAAQVFARSDAMRTPFARRVIERVAFHSCRRDGLPAVQRLAAWFESGGPRGDAGMDPTEIWALASDVPWERPAIERVMRWADAGLPCEPLESEIPPRDGSVPGADSGMDAAQGPP